ncbi:serine/threonine-protein kinase [Microbacterium sp. USHLN186]|uniref:serine/threonine-protein kinase n=1 Tax=Microbacterium sp. USHLN186 TaxID=3081286 RepID=UPI003015A885
MDTVDELATAPLLDGRYRLDGCVGRGATSLVYRAQDTLLGRTVAIKLLRTDDEMALGSERIHAETALLASLSHPALVALYDAKLDLPHPRYLVMEFVDGPTLSAHLKDGALTRTEVAAIAGDLADALRAVHARGIVHRDVKPSNVLLSRAQGRGRWAAKLTDFGIAVDPDAARRTSPGIAIGTAAYMAPEQVRADPLTPAADIYSLGLVLLESLTGESAFPRTRDVQTALARLVSEPAVPDELGPGWARLLRAMTATAPEDRPSAAQVAAEAGALAAAAQADDEVTAATRALPLAAEAMTAPARPASAHVNAAPASARLAAQQTPSSATPDAGRRASSARDHRSERRAPSALRARAVGVLATAAAASAVLAGAWMATPSPQSPAQTVNRTSAPATETVAETAAPEPAQPAPLAEQPAPAEEQAAPSSGTTDEGTTEQSVQTGATRNENAGPGNNSGRGEQASQGKGPDGEGAPGQRAQDGGTDAGNANGNGNPRSQQKGHSGHGDDD